MSRRPCATSRPPSNRWADHRWSGREYLPSLGGFSAVGTDADLGCQGRLKCGQSRRFEKCGVSRGRNGRRTWPAPRAKYRYGSDQSAAPSRGAAVSNTDATTASDETRSSVRVPSSRPLSGCERAWRHEVAAPKRPHNRLFGDFLATSRARFGFIEPNICLRAAVCGTEGQRFESSRARSKSAWMLGFPLV